MDLRSMADNAFGHANAAWEVDRTEMLERSERRAWRVAMASGFVAVLAVGAVLAHGPLQQVVPLPIVVDKRTGETTVQQRLTEETIPVQESLDKHNAAVFVRNREGYSWWWLQRDYDQVARMAVPAVFADYRRQFEGEASLQKRLGGNEEWRIDVVGVRLSATGRKGTRGEATVTYEKTVRQPARGAPDVTTRHVASIVYEYQPKVLSNEADRLENPLGFVVLAYRSDPEIGTVPLATLARAQP